MQRFCQDRCRYHHHFATPLKIPVIPKKITQPITYVVRMTKHKELMLREYNKEPPIKKINMIVVLFFVLWGFLTLRRKLAIDCVVLNIHHQRECKRGLQDQDWQCTQLWFAMVYQRYYKTNYHTKKHPRYVSATGRSESYSRGHKSNASRSSSRYYGKRSWDGVIHIELNNTTFSQRGKYAS